MSADGIEQVRHSKGDGASRAGSGDDRQHDCRNHPRNQSWWR